MCSAWAERTWPAAGTWDADSVAQEVEAVALFRKLVFFSVGDRSAIEPEL